MHSYTVVLDYVDSAANQVPHFYIYFPIDSPEGKRYDSEEELNSDLLKCGMDEMRVVDLLVQLKEKRSVELEQQLSPEGFERLTRPEGLIG